MYQIVGVPVGRTTIVLDDELIKRAMQMSGARTHFVAIARHTPLRLCAV